MKKDMEGMKNPQFSFDELYVPPFSKQRGFDANTLTTVWEPIQFERKKSGVDLLDAVVDCLIAGNDPRRVAWDAGITTNQLSTFVFVLTGLELQKFTTKWKIRKIGEYLRYTNLSQKDVRKLCGYTSSTTFSRIVKENFGVSPTQFRRSKRLRGDLYKYGI